MALILQCARVYTRDAFTNKDIAIEDGKIVAMGKNIPVSTTDLLFSCENMILIPGFADVHVHLREPGFSEKETIRTGSKAAARGGYGVVCSMPNINPAPDTREHLSEQLRLIGRDAAIRVAPVGCLTMGRQGKMPAALEELAPDVCAFSDDGAGVMDDGVMRECMERIRAFDGLVAAHCEDTRYDGNASEWKMIERDLALAAETGCRYHVCHLSTREGLSLIRDAKKAGLRVSCETAPHYLVLDEGDREGDTDGRYHMNPPLRSRADREAMLAGVADGSIDCIATDHAPHTAADKQKGAMGIIGMETAFPVVYTKLVREGVLTLERVVDAMSVRGRELFRVGGGRIMPGEPAEVTCIDLGTPYTIHAEGFASKGRNTPFDGLRVYGRIVRNFAVKEG
ncbi:MAG: dihydroorotase [Clostridiaceae bacterium]|nr:dihydroorotase [Clostridiaceae bacterium]